MNVKQLNDIQLENVWQNQSTIIQQSVMLYYKTTDEKYKGIAERAQQKQKELQEEITRRSK